MRRWGLFGVLALVVLGLLLGHRTEAAQVWRACAAGQPGWLWLAALIQLLFQLNFALLWVAACRLVEVDFPLRRVLPVMFASLALNVLAAGSGVVLFLDDAVRRGESGARVAAAAVLVRVSDFVTFALLLAAAFGYLWGHHDLQAYELVAGGGLLLVIAGWSALLLLAVARPSWLERLLARVQRAVGWGAAKVRRESPLAADWATRSTAEYVAAGRLCTRRPLALAPIFGLAMLAHLVDLGCVAALFRAFGEPVAPGALLAGFCIGVLFWIVALTPQGIGVVEGTMALVYASLGTPAATATAIALAFRGLTFWLPLAVGFVLLPKLGAAPADGRRTERWRQWRLRFRDRWPTLLAAWAAAALSVVDLVSAVTPSVADRLSLLTPHLSLAVRQGGRLTSALAGFALLLLAHGLARRKKTAWAGAVGFLVLSIAGHLVKGLDYEEALLSATLVTYLLLFRHQFFARSDRPSIVQGLTVAGFAAGFTLLYGVLGFYLLDHHFRYDFGLRAAVRQTLVMFTEFYDPGLQPLTGFGRWFADSIYLVGAASGGYALLMLLRPVLARTPATAAERERAREVVARHARSAVSPLALLPDKSYWFSDGGSVIAFVVKSRFALALGDPIGPADDIPAAIRGFAAYCHRNDWSPAFYEALPDYLDDYAAVGLEALCIGEDAVVDLGEFTLEGKPGRALRPPVNKLTKAGYEAICYPPPLDPELLAELRVVSDEWLTGKHGNEKRFSLGWFFDEYVVSTPVMVVRDADKAPVAFANLLDEAERREVTIDLMRHRQELENGVMDYLFVALLQWAQAAGYRTFNLGLSSLSGVGREADDPMVERALHYVYEHVGRFYNFKGLHRFKEKFHPRWEPRYLIHPGVTSLPRVWTAIMRANGGDDFVRGYARR